MQQVDRPGVFRASIVEYGLKEAESGSVAVSIRVLLEQMWDEQAKEWTEWHGFDMEAFGDIWIVKKDGALSNFAVSSLCRDAGWDGSMESIQEKKWQPTQCQVVIKDEEYNGETRRKIAFVNSYDNTPGAFGSNVTSDRVKTLQAKHGAGLRALAGNIKRNGTPNGNGVPKSPPPRQDPPATTYAAPTQGEEIPF